MSASQPNERLLELLMPLLACMGPYLLWSYMGWMVLMVREWLLLEQGHIIADSRAGCCLLM